MERTGRQEQVSDIHRLFIEVGSRFTNPEVSYPNPQGLWIQFLQVVDKKSTPAGLLGLTLSKSLETDKSENLLGIYKGLILQQNTAGSMTRPYRVSVALRSPPPLIKPPVSS